MLRKTAILVVDDRQDDVDLIRLMFKRSRILNSLKSVGSVKDAICYLKGKGVFANRKVYPFPGLLLLDLHLADGSGFDVLSWLQAHKPATPLVVVVLTGSDVAAINRAYDLGAHSFLIKPLKFADFENMVTEVRGIKLTTTAAGHLLELQ
jgi:CheY-like chemotaxis protein